MRTLIVGLPKSGTTLLTYLIAGALENRPWSGDPFVGDNTQINFEPHGFCNKENEKKIKHYNKVNFNSNGEIGKTLNRFQCYQFI